MTLLTLMDDRTLAVLGVVGTLVFGLLSIWLYQRSRQLRRLDALWSIATLQSKKHKEVKILFKNREIEDLSRLRILFVNTGTLAIRPAVDFPSQYSGSVSIKRRGDTSEFLSAAVLVGDVVTCHASAAVSDGGTASVAFEYLNPKQRVGVEVLYSGPPPIVDIKLIGGEVKLKRSLGRSWVDGLVEEFLPLPAVLGAAFSAQWFYRALRSVEFPFAGPVAVLMTLGFAVAIVVGTVKYVVPIWRRRRDKVRERLCLDFLAGRERPNNALHPSAEAAANGRG